MCPTATPPQRRPARAEAPRGSEDVASGAGKPCLALHRDHLQDQADLLLAYYIDAQLLCANEGQLRLGALGPCVQAG